MFISQLLRPKQVRSQHIEIFRRGIKLGLEKYKYSIPKNDDPTNNLKRRMEKIYKEETYYTRQQAGGVDKQAIDRVSSCTKECLKKTHDYPKLQRCFEKVQHETYDIEDYDTRRAMQDTLKHVKNTRPRGVPME